MSSDDLKRAKRSLRREVRARRDALAPEERARRSAALADNLLALPAMARASTVMAFSSFGSEVDLAPVIERLARDGRRVLLPRMEGGSLVAVPYRPGDETRRAAFGALEPAEGEAVDPEEIDVVITPGLAFDRRGRRVGYGGGFYDRFLRTLRPGAVAVGICFALQVVDEVPEGGTDRPVDLVVTEEGVLEPG